MLEIQNLHVRVTNKEIIKGIDLTINSGELHAIMGRNGSGKSTLAHVIAGKEGYEIEGDILYKGESILGMSPDERAIAGIFMSF
jgi:Fe-S cluster assembly ATP-binding protein